MTPIHDSDPRAGWYKMRRVRNGPWLPVTVWWHTAERDEAGHRLEDEGYRCEIDGSPACPYRIWTYVAGHPIAEAEFTRLSALRQWADDHAPDDPYAAPDRSVDLNKAAPIF